MERAAALLTREHCVSNASSARPRFRTAHCRRRAAGGEYGAEYYEQDAFGNEDVPRREVVWPTISDGARAHGAVSSAANHARTEG